ncbi:MAG: TIGR03086 family metal-binding protein [Acidimicrobiales bacterium]
MTTPPQALDDLDVAARLSRQIVGLIGPSDWALPTPCTKWSVRALVSHMLVGNQRFASAAGTRQPPHGDHELSDAQLASAYPDSLEALREAFAAPGALDKTVTVPFGSVPGAVALKLRVTELLVHGWDLVQATGKHVEFPTQTCEEALTFSKAFRGQLPPEGGPFDAPQPVDDDALAIDRLAAYLGRPVARAR